MPRVIQLHRGALRCGPPVRLVALLVHLELSARGLRHPGRGRCRAAAARHGARNVESEPPEQRHSLWSGIGDASDALGDRDRGRQEIDTGVSGPMTRRSSGHVDTASSPLGRRQQIGRGLRLSCVIADVSIRLQVLGWSMAGA